MLRKTISISNQNQLLAIVAAHSYAHCAASIRVAINNATTNELNLKQLHDAIILILDNPADNGSRWLRMLPRSGARHTQLSTALRQRMQQQIESANAMLSPPKSPRGNQPPSKTQQLNLETGYETFIPMPTKQFNTDIINANKQHIPSLAISAELLIIVVVWLIEAYETIYTKYSLETNQTSKQYLAMRLNIIQGYTTAEGFANLVASLKKLFGLYAGRISLSYPIDKLDDSDSIELHLKALRLLSCFVEIVAVPEIPLALTYIINIIWQANNIIDSLTSSTSEASLNQTSVMEFKALLNTFYMFFMIEKNVGAINIDHEPRTVLTEQITLLNNTKNNSPRLLYQLSQIINAITKIHSEMDILFIGLNDINNQIYTLLHTYNVHSVAKYKQYCDSLNLSSRTNHDKSLLNSPSRSGSLPKSNSNNGDDTSLAASASGKSSPSSNTLRITNTDDNSGSSKKSSSDFSRRSFSGRSSSSRISQTTVDISRSTSTPETLANIDGESSSDIKKSPTLSTGSTNSNKLATKQRKGSLFN